MTRPDSCQGISMSQEGVDNLIQSIQNGDLYLVYQPIHDRRKQILGYEALVRCKGKAIGQVSPLKVIHSFEQSHLVDQLNNRFFNLLQKDIECTPALQQNRLCINLTFKQLEDGSLNRNIESLAKMIPYGHMIFEITESAVMHDIEKVLKTMQMMVDKGMSFVLDNFGSGFSSLKYLKLLPLKYIKVDKSFIGEIDINYVDRTIVKAAMEMSKALGLEVIAEGVEKESQLTILEAIGIYFYQGYYFDRPEQACDL